MGCPIRRVCVPGVPPGRHGGHELLAVQLTVPSPSSSSLRWTGGCMCFLKSMVLRWRGVSPRGTSCCVASGCFCSVPVCRVDRRRLVRCVDMVEAVCLPVGTGSPVGGGRCAWGGEWSGWLGVEPDRVASFETVCASSCGALRVKRCRLDDRDSTRIRGETGLQRHTLLLVLQTSTRGTIRSVLRGGVPCFLRVLVVHDFQNVSFILDLIIIIVATITGEERRRRNEERKKKEELRTTRRTKKRSKNPTN